MLLAGVTSARRRTELLETSLRDALSVRELLVLADAAADGGVRGGGAGLVVLHRVVRTSERWSHAAATMHEDLLAELEKPGLSLMRNTAEFIKRQYSDVSVLIRAYAATKDLGEAQGAAVQADLVRELMLAPQDITVQSDIAPFSEDHIEVVLLNR